MNKEEKETINAALAIIEKHDLMLLVETDAQGIVSYSIQKKPTTARNMSYEAFLRARKRAEAEDTQTTSVIALVVSIIALIVAVATRIWLSMR